MDTYTGYNQRVTWEFERFIKLEEFDETKGGVCAKVSILRIEYPKYSFIMGWLDEAGKFVPHFNAGQDISGVAPIALEAKKYIDAQAATVASLIQKKEQEAKEKAKEVRERNERKKKNREENLKVRKRENQARAQSGGKK